MGKMGGERGVSKMEVKVEVNEEGVDGEGVYLKKGLEMWG